MCIKSVFLKNILHLENLLKIIVIQYQGLYIRYIVKATIHTSVNIILRVNVTAVSSD